MTTISRVLLGPLKTHEAGQQSMLGHISLALSWEPLWWLQMWFINEFDFLNVSERLRELCCYC